MTQHMDATFFNLSFISPSLPYLIKPDPISFASALAAVTRLAFRTATPNPLQFDAVLSNTTVQRMIAPLVFHLAFPSSSTTTGPLTRTMHPLRFYGVLPYPLTNYFAALEAHDQLCRVTYIAHVVHPTRGLLTVPVSSVQASKQNFLTYAKANSTTNLTGDLGPQDSLTLEVPKGAQYAADITAMLTDASPAQVYVVERVTYIDGKVSDRALANVTLTGASQTIGARRNTLTLTGAQQSGKVSAITREVALNRIRELRLGDGSMSARVAYDLNDVQASRLHSLTQLISPEDVVTINGTAYTLAKVSLNLTTSDRYIEIATEA